MLFRSKLASEIAEVDALSGGRLEVGFARAFLPHEFRRMGRNMDESRARFDEGVAMVQRLLTEENVSMQGRFHSFEDVTILPRPTQSFFLFGPRGVGKTTWLRTVNQDSSEVAQYGGVVRLDLEHGGLQLRMEGGLASADDRPFDGAVRAFQFASDYRVGLVLFPSMLAATSAQAVRNLGDPRFVGQAPDGSAHIATQGAVAQAAYVQPVLRMRVRPGLHVLVGALWARQTAAMADPFQSFLAGGSPRGPRGGHDGRDLGLEFDGAIEWDRSKPDGAPRKLLDSSRMRALGWTARTALEEGIRQTTRWYLAQSRETIEIGRAHV